MGRLHTLLHISYKKIVAKMVFVRFYFIFFLGGGRVKHKFVRGQMPQDPPSLRAWYNAQSWRRCDVCCWYRQPLSRNETGRVAERKRWWVTLPKHGEKFDEARAVCISDGQSVGYNVCPPKRQAIRAAIKGPHQLAGGDPEEDHDRHGSEPLKLIYGQPTLTFTRRGIEHRITLIGVNSWKR